MKTEIQRLQIVVVDDDMDFQTILRGWLKTRYWVVGLSSGADLLEELRGLEPDLLILDVGLPGTDGFELCRMLRAQGEFADLPILFLTGAASDEAFARYLRVGGTAYMIKPVTRAALLQEVEGLLR